MLLAPVKLWARFPPLTESTSASSFVSPVIVAVVAVNASTVIVSSVRSSSSSTAAAVGCPDRFCNDFFRSLRTVRKRRRLPNVRSQGVKNIESHPERNE